LLPTSKILEEILVLHAQLLVSSEVDDVLCIYFAFSFRLLCFGTGSFAIYNVSVFSAVLDAEGSIAMAQNPKPVTIDGKVFMLIPSGAGGSISDLCDRHSITKGTS